MGRRTNPTELVCQKYEETGGSGKDPPLHLELQKTTTTGTGHN